MNMSFVSCNGTIKEFFDSVYCVLMIQNFVLNSSSVLLMVCCLYCDSIMFFRSFLILIIVFLVDIMVSSNCSQFLVFQICVSIVVISVSTSFLVFGGNDEADMVRICCIGVCSFCVRLL